MVAALGFGGRLGALGAALHIVFHGVTKPLMFFCAGNVQQHFATPYFWRVRGVIRTLPWTGGLFLLATLAVTGTPPFSIFQSEFTTLSAALAAGRGWAAFLFIAGVVTIFAGFLVHMYEDDSRHAASRQPAAGRGVSVENERDGAGRRARSSRSVSGCPRRSANWSNKPPAFSEERHERVARLAANSGGIHPTLRRAPERAARRTAKRNLFSRQNGPGRRAFAAISTSGGTRGLVSVFADDARTEEGVFHLYYIYALDAAHGFIILRVPVSPGPAGVHLTHQRHPRRQLAGARNAGHVRLAPDRPSQPAPLRAA